MGDGTIVRADAGPVTAAVLEGRTALLLFRIGGTSAVPLSRLTPEARLAYREHSRETTVRTAAGSSRAAVIAVSPLLVLAISTALGVPGVGPGWITWLWCSALCAINALFLIGGPVLWNALLTAAVAIDRLGLSSSDADAIADWIRAHYVRMSLQIAGVVAGAGTGMALLLWVNDASRGQFSLGPGEFLTMALTAALAANGLWILWWIAALVPVLGSRPSLRLDWHNPARTPAIVFLNRALWKVGGAISLGMVLLAIAVQGQPSPFMSWVSTPQSWIAAVIVEFVAFLIVGAVFVRDAIWAQWHVLRLVRRQIDRWRAPVDSRLRRLAATYPDPGLRGGKVLYYAELDRHFDSLRSVDLNLGWALAWATSIFGAAASVLATAISITPG